MTDPTHERIAEAMNRLTRTACIPRTVQDAFYRAVIDAGRSVDLNSLATRHGITSEDARHLLVFFRRQRDNQSTEDRAYYGVREHVVPALCAECGAPVARSIGGTCLHCYLGVVPDKLHAHKNYLSDFEAPRDQEIEATHKALLDDDAEIAARLAAPDGEEHGPRDSLAGTERKAGECKTPCLCGRQLDGRVFLTLPHQEMKMRVPLRRSNNEPGRLAEQEHGAKVRAGHD